MGSDHASSYRCSRSRRSGSGSVMSSEILTSKYSPSRGSRDLGAHKPGSKQGSPDVAGRKRVPLVPPISKTIDSGPDKFLTDGKLSSDQMLNERHTRLTAPVRCRVFKEKTERITLRGY